MNESVVEDAALAWLQSIGWMVMHGPELGPDPVDAERQDYGQVVLEERLREALLRLNPTLPVDSTLSSPSGATSSSSFCLTRFENSSAKGAISRIIVAGRVGTSITTSLADCGDESVPYPFRSQIAKVELPEGW